MLSFDPRGRMQTQEADQAHEPNPHELDAFGQRNKESEVLHRPSLLIPTRGRRRQLPPRHRLPRQRQRLTRASFHRRKADRQRPSTWRLMVKRTSAAVASPATTRREICPVRSIHFRQSGKRRFTVLLNGRGEPGNRAPVSAARLRFHVTVSRARSFFRHRRDAIPRQLKEKGKGLLVTANLEIFTAHTLSARAPPGAVWQRETPVCSPRADLIDCTVAIRSIRNDL